MKKALVVLLALTALGTAAFAADMAPVWTWGAVVNTGVELTMANAGSTTLQVFDNNEPGITRQRFIGNVDMGGFGYKFYLGWGDSAAPTISFVNWWIYANLFNNMVQVNVGAMDNSFSGTVNKGYGGTSPAGAQVVLMPIDGLKIGFAVPVNANIVGANINAMDALTSIQLGAFYTMPNLASFALTYVNAKTTATGLRDKSSEFDFGVAVLAVPNLTAQFEGNLVNLGDSTAYDSVAGTGGRYELFQNVAYVMGALTPSLTLYEDIYSVSGAQVYIQINPAIDYMVMTGSNVGLSVTYKVNPLGVAGTTGSGLVVDPYVKFTFNSKAAVKIDAAYTIADLTATGTWSMPININFLYSF